MSQLTTYPLADWFKATLDQSYNGTGTTIYVDDVPNITRPSGVFTYLVIAPKTSNQQIVKLSWFDTIGKTFTVSSTTVKKWAGTNYSTFTHAIGTEVIISSNYAFWEDIKTAINDNATNIATNTASIAAINNTINSNINTIQAGSYISANSSDVDDAYDATLSPAITAYTDKMMVNIKFTTVNTWACALNLNGLWAKSIKTKDWNDPQNWIIRAWWVYQLIFDGTNFIIQNEDFATTANKWIVELATTAEALAWSDTERAVTAEWVKLHNKTEVQNFTRSTTGTQTITHSLGKVPQSIRISAKWPFYNSSWVSANNITQSEWVWDGTNNRCTAIIYDGTVWSSTIQNYSVYTRAWNGGISNNNSLCWIVQNVTSSQFEIAWSELYTWATHAINYTVHIS